MSVFLAFLGGAEEPFGGRFVHTRVAAARPRARERVAPNDIPVTADEQFGARADEAIDRVRDARRISAQPAKHVGAADRRIGFDDDLAGEHHLGECTGIDRRERRRDMSRVVANRRSQHESIGRRRETRPLTRAIACRGARGDSGSTPTVVIHARPSARRRTATAGMTSSPAERRSNGSAPMAIGPVPATALGGPHATASSSARTTPAAPGSANPPGSAMRAATPRPATPSPSESHRNPVSPATARRSTSTPAAICSVLAERPTKAGRAVMMSASR